MAGGRNTDGGLCVAPQFAGAQGWRGQAEEPEHLVSEQLAVAARREAGLIGHGGRPWETCSGVGDGPEVGRKPGQDRFHIAMMSPAAEGPNPYSVRVVGLRREGTSRSGACGRNPESAERRVHFIGTGACTSVVARGRLNVGGGQSASERRWRAGGLSVILWRP
ncbi:hypothetical protein SAV14893_085590 [Streptomyces avermitilis]|uniref:Uncharacterized protein n=1 Tax=Streptomyces avermitilis TaxID=33903 RepID=A0A4D4MBA8_STRAX|nr:hypothetical protein SAV14893_085590 [Streptomyces avermitilis]GDY79414.1 hypothetical protein SAV31267_088990 [Streptomyces avermitilis]GDY88345.1 hypothetical protein SAVCW2_75440 [Streptomyces avermitilis]